MNINISDYIHTVPDFPKEGIMFKDISPLLGDPAAFKEVVSQFESEWKNKVDAIVALDARGFLFGAPLAQSLHLPLVMLRKKGKLPGNTHSISYDLEYGQSILEIPEDALAKNSRVLIVDDLLATGGTACAASSLVQQTGSEVVGYAFVIELNDLGGRKLLNGSKIQSLVSYEEE